MFDQLYSWYGALIDCEYGVTCVCTKTSVFVTHFFCNGFMKVTIYYYSK
jgi:hypothetical protein